MLVPFGALLFLKVTVAITLWCLLLHVLVFITAFWWLAAYRLRPVSCFLGAITIAFCSSIVFRFTGGHPNIVAPYIWGFVLLGSWIRWWQSGLVVWLLSASAAFSLMLFGCEAQSAYHMGLWWSIISLLGLGDLSRKALVRWFASYSSVCIAGIAGAAVLLFPQLEFASLAPRAHMSVYEAGTYNLPLENLLLLVFPGAFGFGWSGDLEPASSGYLGRWLYTWETGLLLNPLALVFCFYALIHCRNRRTFPLSGAALFCLLVAVGRQLPFYWLTFKFLPGMSIFRAPARLAAPTLFSIAGIAAIGVDTWLNTFRPLTLRKPLVTLSLLCVFGVLFGIGWIAPASDFAFVPRWFANLSVSGWNWEVFPKLPAGSQLSQFQAEVPLDVRTQVFSRAAALACSLGVILFSAYWALNRFPVFRNSMGRFLAATAALWGIAYAWPANAHMDVSSVPLPSVVANALKTATANGRSMMIGPGDRNQAIYSDVPVVAGYAALLANRQNTLLALVQEHPLQSPEFQSIAQHVNALARWLNVSSFFMAEGTPMSGAGERTYSANGVSIVKPEWSAPGLVFSLSNWKSAENSQAAIDLLNRDKDAGDSVVVEGEKSKAGGDSRISPLQYRRASPTLIDVSVPPRSSGRVVLLESLYPGWKASASGKPLTIAPAQIAFQSVEIPENSNSITWNFQPASFRIGLFISLFTLTVLVLGVITGRRLLIVIPQIPRIAPTDKLASERPIKSKARSAATRTSRQHKGRR